MFFQKFSLSEGSFIVIYYQVKRKNFCYIAENHLFLGQSWKRVPLLSQMDYGVFEVKKKRNIKEASRSPLS